ncbi:TPA: hypothetical protein ACWLUJ_005784 [Pseudomonas aeruginosa]|nr:hypothetical protein [Pseudomonas aeruginosa]EIU2864225.1 hypothetical protein [Pseudomonas aeruginosa]HEJ2342267.1 hypothetical protein [Pseudomonas aeruginosa]HEK3716929.1 hypothetical protein [Pseudomonas aeruginosa]
MWKKKVGAPLFIALCLLGMNTWASSSQVRFDLWTSGIPAPTWSNDDVAASAYVFCSIGSNSLGWPSGQCDEPVMTVNNKSPFSSDRPFIAHGTLVIPDSKDPEKAAAIFQALQSDPAPAPILKVSLKQRDYFDGTDRMVVRPPIALQDFHAQVADYIQQKEQRIQSEVLGRRVSYVLSIVLPLLLLAFIAVVGRYLFKHRQRLWERSIGRFTRWAGGLAQSLEDKRLRRLAIDEAVKLSVQNSISSARSGDTAELERMIASAVQRGDTEAAAALSAALERIMGSSREGRS